MEKWKGRRRAETKERKRDEKIDVPFDRCFAFIDLPAFGPHSYHPRFIDGNLVSKAPEIIVPALQRYTTQVDRVALPGTYTGSDRTSITS